jgi:hypothetical protein
MLMITAHKLELEPKLLIGDPHQMTHAQTLQMRIPQQIRKESATRIAQAFIDGECFLTFKVRILPSFDMCSY